jgi:hypothetical protein
LAKTGQPQSGQLITGSPSMPRTIEPQRRPPHGPVPTPVLAHLFERFSAGLNRFDHRAPADLVAQASRFEILDNGLFSSFLVQLVDGGLPSLCPGLETV